MIDRLWDNRVLREHEQQWAFWATPDVHSVAPITSAVATEVLQRPVQTFLGSKDGSLERADGFRGSKPRRKGWLRRRAMFRRLSSGRYLRMGVEDRGFWVGFSGKASEIADIHQHGLRDKPSLRARAIPYPKRELVGATEANREMLINLLYEQIVMDQLDMSKPSISSG